MAQIIACQCGQRFSAADHLAGKTLKCPSCSQPLRIPPLNPPAKQQVPVKQKIVVSCHTCGSRYATASKNLNKAMSCLKCGQKFIASERSPDAPASSPAHQAFPATNESADLMFGAAPFSHPALPLPRTAAPGGLANFLHSMETANPYGQQIGFTIGGFAFVFCIFEMVPGWGFLQLGWPPIVFYGFAFVVGAVGGFIGGRRYCIPGMIGSAIGVVGALFAASCPLYYVDTIPSSILLLLSGIGMIPGILVYRGLSYVQDGLVPPVPSKRW